MKKIFFALASFALISSANAADGSDVKFNAELWFKYYSNNQADFTQSGTDTYWTQRTKLGAHWSKGDDLGAQITLLSGNVWGNKSSLAAVGASQPFQGSGAGLGYRGQGIDVYEAWAFWKAMDNFVLKVGRGAMDIGDGTVVSKNDELLHPYTFDGVLGAFYTEFAAFNFFGVKGADDSKDFQDNAGKADSEIDFYGLSVDVRNLPEVLKMVNIHVLEQKVFGLANGAANVDDSKLRYGISAKGDVMHIDYRGSFAGYTGKKTSGVAGTTTDVTENATMFDLEGGYTFADIMNLRLSGTYHTDSGNSDLSDATTTKKYDPFFYNYDYAGLMHVLQWGNLTYFKLGASLEPMESLKVALDYYNFSKTQAGDNTDYFWGNNANGSTTRLAAGTATTDKSLGSEIDLSVRKKMSNGVNVGAFYGMFKPASSSVYTQTTAISATNTFSQIGLDAKFAF